LNAAIQTALAELTAKYASVKNLVLRAEELDPSFRSNIMVIKEMRDCNDHMMRAFCEILAHPKMPNSDDYILMQIDKAKGHVLRAGYDAIDGIIVGSKLKIVEAMRNISNEAIAAVFPEYYTNAPEIEALDNLIASHRSKKDVGDATLDNLDGYAQTAERVSVFFKTTMARVPLMIEWDRKDRKKAFFEKVVLVIIIGIIIAVFSGFFAALFGSLFHRHDPPQTGRDSEQMRAVIAPTNNSPQH
jgi:hypothetical protein